MQSTLAVQQAVATFSAQTQAAQAQPTEEVAAAEPTATLTTEPPAAAEALRASANINVNCRMGPAAVFTLVVSLKAGETVEVIGKNTDNGLYWKVKTENGKECWLLGDAVSLSGSADAVTMLVAPATPTPIPPPSWAGTWTLHASHNVTNPSENVRDYVITIAQTGNEISYQYSYAGNTYSVGGTVSTDGMSVNGTWSINGIPWGNVRLIRVPSNLNQFQGKWWALGVSGLDGEQCGFMNGAGIPSPCRP